MANTESMVAITKAYSQQVQGLKEYTAALNASRTYTLPEITRRLKKCADLVNERMQQGKPFAIGELVLAANTNKNTWAKLRHGEYDYMLTEYIASNNLSFSDTYDIEGQLYIDVLDDKTGEIVQTPLAPFSDLIEKMYQQHEVFLELNMYNNKSMPSVTADIFALKARHKWDDKPEQTQQVTNNNLIIADKEQAQRAMELLSGK